MEISSYRDLKVWQSAIELATRIYALSADFPKSEVYGLTAQMRRAAVSVAANIAEGHGRETTAALIQFLRIAQGSVKEVETHVIIDQRLDFPSTSDAEAVLSQCDEIGRMIRGLIRSLQEKQQRSET
jgi:four helix bundle protein